MRLEQFFKSLRAKDSGAFGTSLSQAQVDGCISLLDACAGFSIPHTAHVMAEVYHETGGRMMPVKETVFAWSKDKNPPDAKVIARLDRAWAKGQLLWVKEPYWRDGWFGRGQIQITHKTNYQKGQVLTGTDIVNHPEWALDLTVSSRIAADGCRTGMFRGHKLADFDRTTTYLGAYDHYEAREIVNGDKKKVGRDIVGYAHAFERALKAAGWGALMLPPDVPPPEPSNEPVASGKSPVSAKATGIGVAIAALIAAAASQVCNIPFINQLFCGG